MEQKNFESGGHPPQPSPNNKDTNENVFEISRPKNGPKAVENALCNEIISEFWEELIESFPGILNYIYRYFNSAQVSEDNAIEGFSSPYKNFS